MDQDINRSTLLGGKIPVSQVTGPLTVRVVKDQRHSVVTSNEPTIADGLQVSVFAPQLDSMTNTEPGISRVSCVTFGIFFPY